MKRVIQILIFAIIAVSVPTDSHSFISALTKGGKLLFKGKIWKSGAATGASSIDNVAKKALDIKKIDKNLIDEIGKAEHEKIFKSIKETPDEKVLSEYKHYDDTSIEDIEFNWLVPRPAYRHLGKEVKSENSVYVCEKNNGEIFYFSIMPKRNKALVTSTDKNVDKQRLIVLYVKAQGTILKTKESNNYFVLLPNYKFYSDASNNLENLIQKINDSTIPINGECYDTDEEDKKKLVRYELKKGIDAADWFKALSEKSAIDTSQSETKTQTETKTQKKTYTSTTSQTISFKIPLIIFFVALAWYIFMNFWEKYAKKSEKRLLKLINIHVLINFIWIVLLNIVGLGSFFSWLAFRNILGWHSLILFFIFIYYVLQTAAHIQTSYKSIKEDNKGPGALQLKIINYQNILIPIFFLLVFLIIYNS